MTKPLSVVILLAAFAGVSLAMAFAQRKSRPGKIGEAFPSNVVDGVEFFWT